MKKLIISFLSILILMLILFQTNTFASSLSMSTSKGEVTIGDTVTVTISFGQKVAVADVNLSFDSSKFAYKSVSAGTANSAGSNVKVSYFDSTGGTKPISSMTFTFTSIGTGTGSFKASCSNTTDVNVNPVTVSGNPSKSVTVKEKVTETKKPTTTETKTPSKPTPKKDVAPKKEDTSKKENTKKSDNTNLSSINIEGLSITPAFNKDTTKYYLSVNQDVSNINITANAEDTKSKIEILGNADFKIGLNNVIIKVTAENGATKEYIVEVNKQDMSIGLSSLKISLNEQILDFSPIFDKNTLNYTLNTNEASKLEIEALANHEDASITIVGNESLKNGENTITITVQKDEEVKVYTLTVNNTITKKKPLNGISSFFSNTWMVLLVSFCALIQSAIAIYYAVLAYKNTNSIK